MNLTFFIVDDGVGERGASDIFHAKLMVPLTVEIVYFESPFSLRFKLIEDSFEISAVGTVRSEEFDKFKG